MPLQPQTLDKNWSAGLDVLRVLLCCAVVCFHYLPEKTGLGPYAVNGFLVLSGFLVGVSLRFPSFDVIQFYNKKAQRLVPMFLFAMLLSMSFKAVGAAVLPGNSFLPTHLSGGRFNPILWADYYNYAGWYMVLEFCLLLTVPFLYSLSRSRCGLKAVFVVGILLSFTLFQTEPRQETYALYAGELYYSPWTRFWQFVGGMLSAQFLQRHVRGMQNLFQSARTLPYLFVLFVILAFTPLLLRKIGVMEWWEYTFGFDVVTTLFFMVMVSCLYQVRVKLEQKFAQVLRIFAALTYPVFLVHAPILKVSQWFIGSFCCIHVAGIAEIAAVAVTLLLAVAMLQMQKRWVR